MDKGYDNNRVFDEARERGAVPIICLRKGRAIPLTAIPYGSEEWKRLYRGRSAVEREFGRLKNEYGLTPLRTRGLVRVRQHADLVMIARLGQALVRASTSARRLNSSRQGGDGPRRTDHARPPHHGRRGRD